MHQMRADYGMTKPSRFKRDRHGFNPAGSGADFHIRSQPEFLRMIELAREMEREDPLLRQAIRRVVNNIQTGAATPDPQTGDDEVNKILFDDWQEWGNDPLRCHEKGTMTWRRMTNVGLGRTFIDGDYSGLPLASERIQTLEAHRMRTPESSKISRGVCGVESNNEGRPIRYWITKESVDPTRPAKVSEVTPYDAIDSDGHQQFFHVFDPERFSLSRGITRLAQVYDIRGMTDDVEFAQLVKQQVAACVAYAEKWETGSERPKSSTIGDGPLEHDLWGDGTPRELVNMVPGKILRSYPGQSWEALNPNMPGDGYHKQISNLLTYFAVALDLPRVVLLLDASDSNFSSYRNVMLEARKTYREIQVWHVNSWHAPVWRWRCRVLLKRNPALQRFVEKNGPDGLRLLTKHVWNPPGWDYIEPVADATRWQIELGNGMTSWRRFYAHRHGTDNEVMTNEIVEDFEYRYTRACEAAERINARFPQFAIKDPWELCPRPSAIGVTQSTTLSETVAAEGSPNAQPA